MNTKLLLDILLELQSLEFGGAAVDDASEKEMDRKIAGLRLKIPLPVLNHYDRLGARGKKGVAAVRHQTCTGCHVQVTKAVVINLMHAEDIQVCENCGRYLYLPEPDLTEMPESQKPSRWSHKQAEMPVAA